MADPLWLFENAFYRHEYGERYIQNTGLLLIRVLGPLTDMSKLGVTASKGGLWAVTKLFTECMR